MGRISHCYLPFLAAESAIHVYIGRDRARKKERKKEKEGERKKRRKRERNGEKKLVQLNNIGAIKTTS
jgi:hypothetical protein